MLSRALSRLANAAARRVPAGARALSAASAAPTSADGLVLPDGRVLPWVGLGTFGSDWQDAAKIGASVGEAMDRGYRHFDCAPAYFNHREVGEALKDGMARNGLSRGDIFVTSKLGNDGHDPADVRRHLDTTLEELGLTYLDQYVTHWPWPNFHPPGCAHDFINPDSRPYIHASFMATYREIEKAHREGLVLYPGVSNMTVPKMRLVLRDADVKPVVNQIECHPHFQQEALVQLHRETGVHTVGYMPIGSPNRPARDVFPEHTEDLKDPVLLAMADKYGITPGQVALRLQIQRGVAVIPQTANPDRLSENLAAASLPPFSDEDFEALLRIDKNCRLIYGQVFSWTAGMPWRDLWDDLGDGAWLGPINGSQAKEHPAE